jgi:signal peptide peptidase SppA
MKDLHLIRFALANEWALLPAKIVDLMGMLAYHASGQKHTPGELQALVGGDRSPAEPSQRGAVAVLPLRGVISHRAGGIEEASGGASVERFTAMYRQAMTNDAIGAVVIDVDSPGGTVAGVEGIVSEMQALKGRKPVVAVANSLMASAAYWIASQADEIVSIPSGTVGSIGVFTAHQDLSVALEQEGVKVTLISAGKFKVEGNPFEPLSDEAKAVIQARVDDAYGTFVKAVAKGRGVSAADVKAGYGEGRALGAKDALAAGMIDRIGTLDDTLRRMSGAKGSKGLRADAIVEDTVNTNHQEMLVNIEGNTDADRERRLRLS